MPVTISGLPNATVPLVGTERTVIDQLVGGNPLTRDVAVSDIAKLAELYAATNLGARPERIDLAAAHFTTQPIGDPLTTWFPPTIVTAPAYGPVVEATGQLRVYTRGVVPAGIDKVYEVEAEFEQVSVAGGEMPVCRVGVVSLDGNYVETDTSARAHGGPTSVMVADQIVTVRSRFSTVGRNGIAAWADPSTAVWLRPFADANLDSGLSAFEAASVARLRRLLIRDVTSLVLEAERLEAEAWFND